MQQTQSELRIAQGSLTQSKYGKDSRLKILRKTHQSALSLKQTLIQELQDIITQKDGYIDHLEERIKGNESGAAGLKIPEVVCIIIYIHEIIVILGVHFIL